MDTATTLMAIEEIKALKSRYFHAIDAKEWATSATLFTPDASVDFSGEPQYHVGRGGMEEGGSASADWTFTGGEAVAAFLASALADLISVHHGHDPQITLIGPDSATGLWSMYDRLDFGTEVMHGYGHYHEEYRRTDDGWKFSRLVLTRIRVIWETVPT